MKRQQVTAILLSVILTASVCLPGLGIHAYAAEESDAGNGIEIQEDGTGALQEDGTGALQEDGVKNLQQDDIAPSEKDDIVPSEKDDIVPSEEDDIAPSEENDIAPSEENDIVPSEENDIAPSEENDIVPSEENDIAPSEENDIVPSEGDDLVPSEDDDVVPSEVDDIVPSEEDENLYEDRSDGTGKTEDIESEAVEDEEIIGEESRDSAADAGAEAVGSSWGRGIQIFIGSPGYAFFDDNDGISFTFTPEEDGYYTFYSMSDFNMHCIFYNGEDEELNHYYDGGEGGNFRFTAYLNAGEEYRLNVAEENGENCEVTVCVEAFGSIVFGNMELYGDASKLDDFTIELTPSEGNKAGSAWLMDPFSTENGLTVNFSYYAGGGDRADGLALMFSESKGVGQDGANLGFVDGATGVEFDSWEFSNPEDMHVAVIQGSTDNHISIRYNENVSNSQWHDVSILYRPGYLVAYMDGEEVIHAVDVYLPESVYIGASASTGDLYEQHLIREITAADSVEDFPDTEGWENENAGSPGDGEDHSMDFESAVDITAGGSLTVDVTPESPYAFFRFVPEETRSYIFTATGSNIDTYGILFDSGYEEITRDDDSGNENNFRIVCECVAEETYYLRANEFNNGEGTFTVSICMETYAYIKGTNENRIEIPVGRGAAQDLAVTVEADKSAEVHYTWYQNGEEIEDADSADYTTTGVFSDTEFQCHVSDSYGYDRDLYFNLLIDDFLSAEEIHFGDSVEASFTDDQRWIYYKFIPEEDGIYAFYTESDYNTHACLHTETERNICYADDGGDGENFKLVYRLKAHETYYISIAEMNSEDCTVTLRLVKPSFVVLGDEVVNLSAYAGEEVTMSVDAEAAEPLTYTWYEGRGDWSEGLQEIEDETGNSLTLVPGYARGFSCHITDGTEEAWRYFFIDVRNLRAWLDGYEKDKNNSSQSVEIEAVSGSEIPLHVNAETTGSNEIKYRWYNVTDGHWEGHYEHVKDGHEEWVDDDEGGYYDWVDDSYDEWVDDEWIEESESEIEGANDADFTAGPVDGPTHIRCRAFTENAAGEIADEVCINITLDLINHLRAYPHGSAATERVSRKYVSKNDDVELSTEVTCDDSDGLTFHWFDPDGNEISDAEGARSYTISSIQKKGDYICRVQDGYGNSIDVLYKVVVLNDFEETVELTEGTPAQVEVTEDAPIAFFSFTPQEDGLYIFSSDSEYNTWATLYNADYEEILSDSDSGEDDNFSISHMCSAGETYYLRANRYSYEAGTFTVSVEKASFYVNGDEVQRVDVQADSPGAFVETTLQVDAYSENSLSYQWYRGDGNDGGEALPGETSASCTVSVNEMTRYSCYITDGENDAWRFFDVCVRAENNLRAWIHDHYEEMDAENSVFVDLNANEGDDVTLTVDVDAIDPDGITYQWYDDVWEEIEGADTSEYTVTGLSGNIWYYCRVSDKYGNQVNIRVSFDVTPVDHSMDFESALDIGLGESRTVEVTETSPYAFFRFVPEETREYIFTAINNDIDTYGTLFNSEFVDIASDDQDGVDSNFRIVYECTKGETYYLRANQYYYEGGTFTVVVGIDNHLKAWLHGHEENKDENDQSVNLTAYAGSDVDLVVDVEADDSDGITYQWYDNDWNEIEGADTSDYHITDIYDSYCYYCRVTDQYGNQVKIGVSIDVDYNVFDNDLHVYPVGHDIYETYTVLQIDPPEETVLETEVSAVDMEGITGQWYQLNSTTYKYDILEGVTSGSLTINKSGTYKYRVTDKYSNTAEVEFDVYMENHLHAWPQGGETDSEGNHEDRITIQAQPGDLVTLTTEYQADNTDDIDIHWYTMTEDERGYLRQDEELSSGSDTYTTDPLSVSTTYQCEVTDKFGNHGWATFELKLNNLHAYAYGEEDEYADISITGGETETLRVAVEADDLSQVEYHWSAYCWDPEEKTYVEREYEGTDSDRITVGQKGDYTCRITDQYNNSVNVHFYVSVNHFRVAGNGLYRDEYNNEYDICVANDTPAQLEAYVEGDDTEGVSYRWERYSEQEEIYREEIPDADTDTYTVQAPLFGDKYYCKASDRYGNEATVCFRIFTNSFNAYVDGFEEAGTHIFVDTDKNGDATLRIVVSADDMSEIHYEWTDDLNEPLDISGGTCAFHKSVEWTEYRYCRVSDQYGNSKFFSFYIDWPEKGLAIIAGIMKDIEGNDVPGNMTGLDTYLQDDEVTLEAPRVEGYNFTGWYVHADEAPYFTGEPLATTRAYTFTVSEDADFTAVYEPLGKAEVTIDGGESFLVNGDEKNSPEIREYPLGSSVTVEVDSENFAYWKNSYGAVLSREQTYTFTVSGNTSVIAEFNTVEEEKVTVVFESAYNQIMARELLKKGDKMPIPTVPTRDGYTTFGWDMNGDREYDENTDTLEAAIQRGFETQDKLVTVYAVYELLPVTFTINVINGSGTNTDIYNQNDVVVVRADDPEDGMIFSHWQDENGTILSYNRAYSFYAEKNLSIKAVYVEETEKVEALGTTSIVNMYKDTENKKLVFVSMSNVPVGCTINNAGTIATDNPSVAESGDGFNASTATFVRGDASKATSYRFTWSKGKVTEGNTWYVRAYLVYTDKDGNTHTVYGDIVSQTY